VFVEYQDFVNNTHHFFMKKLSLFIIALFLQAVGMTQIPEGYYDDAVALEGEQLKIALYGIIKNHTRFPYTSSSTDVWDILKEADEDPNNNNNVILLYTGRSQIKSENAGENLTYTGNRWNREHVWSKSHGFPSESDTAYTDCHHLRPSDESVNTDRSNLDFDEGGSQHSEATECFYDSDSWEPRDEIKGDVARMMFYMAVRYDPGYHSAGGQYDLELVDYTGTSSGEALFGKESTLYAWHLADPVDDLERARNEVIYSYQENRNPFIDHPEYANMIWGDGFALEPSNYVDNFSAHTIKLEWTDAIGDILPEGYLIKMSATSFDAITEPVDGTQENDSFWVKNISYGVEQAIFGELTPSTNYYFKMWGYKGSGSTIDYKTDGEVAQISKIAR